MFKHLYFKQIYKTLYQQLNGIMTFSIGCLNSYQKQPKFHIYEFLYLVALPSSI